METLYIVLAGVFSLVGLGCFIVIVIDAFKDAVWKGLASLFCCGLYALYYAFIEFDHEHKWPIVLGYLGGGLVANIFLKLAGWTP